MTSDPDVFVTMHFTALKFIVIHRIGAMSGSNTPLGTPHAIDDFLARMQVGFSVDVLDMHAYGCGRDAEVFGNCLLGFAQGIKRYCLGFTVGQAEFFL